MVRLRAAKWRVALVMAWDDGQTAQIEDIADESIGDELRLLKDVYLRRLADGHQRAGFAGMAGFRVLPVWIRYGDFRTTPPTVVVFNAKELQPARGQRGR